MAWRLGIVAALGALLFLSSPAAAGIQRYVDSRGVVHIRNTDPGAQPSPVDSQAAPPVAEPQPDQPQTPTPQPAAADLSPQAQPPQGQAEALPESPAPQAVAKRGPIQVAHEVPPGTRSAEEAENGSRLPLQKVSYPVAEPAAVQVKGAGRGPGPLEAKEDIIWRFRDRRGVLHITNLAPQPKAAATTEADAGASESRPLAREPAADTPYRQVSWSDSGAASPVTAAMPVPGGPDPAPGAIRRYRDGRGVLHIENVPAEGRQAEPAVTLARAGKGRKHIEIFGNDGAPLLPLKKAAWTAEAVTRGPPLGLSREIPARQVDILAEGSIRRYRDGKGVLHIESVDYPGPQAVPGPMLLARPEIGRPGSPAYAALAPPPGNPAEGFVGRGPPAADSRVMAYRDRKGRLSIRNQAPALQVAEAPPRPQAMAQLDPILQEASQLYGLPVALIQALIKVESNFVFWAVSPKGAMGLMQLMPGTATFLGVHDPFNPRDNIHGGCRYLRLLLDFFGGSLPLALAAYNAGYQRVISCGFQVPPIKETQDFVTQVLGRYFSAQKRGRSPWV